MKIILIKNIIIQNSFRMWIIAKTDLYGKPNDCIKLSTQQYDKNVIKCNQPEQNERLLL